MSDIKRIFDLSGYCRNNYPGSHILFSVKRGDEWIQYTSRNYNTICGDLAMGMLDFGIDPGDKVGVIMDNCPEWNFIDMALQMIGAVQVPIYPTISEEHYVYILEHAGIKCLFVAGSHIYSKVDGLSLPLLKDIFTIDENGPGNWWFNLVKSGRKSGLEEKLKGVMEGVKSEDTATIIYTSGTTGFPKGVMLSHENIIFNFTTVAGILKNAEEFPYIKRTLSFLPLCHIYERMLNYMYQYLGISIYYCRMDQIPEMIQEVKPDMFTAVPRLLEKILIRIILKGKSLPLPLKALFNYFLENAYRYDPASTKSVLEKVRNYFAYHLLLKKWRKGLGGNVRIIVSGGAKLQEKIARAFWAAGIKVVEGYGLTETSPVVAVNTIHPDGTRPGTVGPVIEGVKVSFDEDGEILVKSPGLMQGYFLQEELTASVIDSDGWFHTGDIGEFAEEKFLKITDRKKEIFKTSGGKYVAPQVVENLFKESSFIGQIIVIGENRKCTTAIIIPDFDYLTSWCRVKNLPAMKEEEMVVNKRIISRYKREVMLMNKKLDSTEQVKDFLLLSDNWSIETGELSPTLKLKRNHIIRQYSPLIRKMYDGIPESRELI